jgi:hypothetical protein
MMKPIPPTSNRCEGDKRATITPIKKSQKAVFRVILISFHMKKAKTIPKRILMINALLLLSLRFGFAYIVVVGNLIRQLAGQKWGIRNPSKTSVIGLREARKCLSVGEGISFCMMDKPLSVLSVCLTVSLGGQGEDVFSGRELRLFAS